MVNGWHESIWNRVELVVLQVVFKQLGLFNTRISDLLLTYPSVSVSNITLSAKHMPRLIILDIVLKVEGRG